MKKILRAARLREWGDPAWAAKARVRLSHTMLKKWNNPKARRKFLKAMAKPEVQAKKSASIRAAFKDPKIKAKYLAATSTPEHRAKRGAGIRRHWAEDASPAKRKKYAKMGRERMANPKIRKAIIKWTKSKEYRELKRQAMKKRMTDPKYAALMQSPAMRKKRGLAIKRSWTPERKRKWHLALKKRWADPKYHQKMTKIRQNQGKRNATA